jgi:hypothetical protein
MIEHQEKDDGEEKALWQRLLPEQGMQGRNDDYGDQECAKKRGHSPRTER